MDWAAIGGGLVALVSSGWGEIQRRRAKAAADAKKAAEAAAERALENAMDRLAESVNRAAENMEETLMEKVPGAAGAKLLNDLAMSRAAAIERGRALALQRYRETVDAAKERARAKRDTTPETPAAKGI